MKAVLERRWAGLADRWRQVAAVLMAQRLRTAMSMLGVALGTAALLLVQVATDAGRRAVFAELETYGLTTLWIFRDWNQVLPGVQRSGSGIDNDDYAAIRRSRCCPDVVRFGAVVYPQNWLVTLVAEGRMNQAAVEGVDVDYLAINNDRIQAGRNLRPADVKGRRPVALIGPTVRERLFGPHRSALGRTFRLGQLRFTIVGELAYKDRSLLAAIGATQGYDVNNRVLIPYTVYQQIMGGTRDIQTLQAQARSLDRVEAAGEQVVRFLARRHHDRYRYRVQDMRAWIGTAEEILDTIGLVGTGAALVALLVGGMGILGVMSTAVLERTREIGLRKAVGARRRDILRQFLAEAAVVGLLGGVLGLGLAMLGLVAVWAWFGTLFWPTPLQVAWAVAIALGTALLAGLLPARRAAALPPAEALRYDG